MPEIKIDFEVYCGTCGVGLCGITTVTQHNDLSIEACPKCISIKNSAIQGLEEEIVGLETELKELKNEHNI